MAKHAKKIVVCVFEINADSPIKNTLGRLLKHAGRWYGMECLNIDFPADDTKPKDGETPKDANCMIHAVDAPREGEAGRGAA